MGIAVFMPLTLIIAIVVTISATARAPLAVSGNYRAVAHVHRRLLASRICGFALGLIGAIAFVWIIYRLTPGDQNVLVLLIGGPVVFSLIYLGCLLVSEVSAYRPATPQRSAGLRSRSITDYLARRVAVVAGLATIWVTAALVAQYAIANDSGSVLIRCGFDGGTTDFSDDVSAVGTSTIDRGTTIAMGVSLAAAALVALAVVLAAVRRARPDTDLIATSEDDALRRNSIQVAGGIYTALVAIIGAVTTFSLADGLTHNFSPCAAPAWWPTAGTALMWSLLGWLALFVWSVVQISARPTATRTSASIG